MIEPKDHNSTAHFIFHLTRNSFFGLLFIFMGLFGGMCGYHTFEKMPWVDAFVNAAMILSGMGPVDPLHTHAGKIFAGCYALFSGLAFIAIVALIFAPIVHRFFHKIHLESDSTS
jgi:hypothetical protein